MVKRALRYALLIAWQWVGARCRREDRRGGAFFYIFMQAD
jgi:hypothetical protein